MPDFVADKEIAPQHDPVYLATTFACGERGDHVAEIERSKWPPKPTPGLSGPPFVSGRCTRCGVNLIVEDPPGRDMTVVLVDDKVAVSGERSATAGKVVDAKDHRKPGGKVVGG